MNRNTGIGIAVVAGVIVVALAIYFMGRYGGSDEGGQAGAQAPGDFVHHMNVGKARLENRETAQAIEALKAALAADPTSAAGWRNLARAHFLIQEYDAALAAVNKSFELDADAVGGLYVLGLIQSHQSRFAEAKAALSRAAQLDPQTAAIRYQLAMVLQNMGEHEEAKTQLDETIKLDPLHSGAYWQLAGHCRRAKDRACLDEALADFNRIKELRGGEEATPDEFELCRYTIPEGPAVAEGGVQPDQRMIKVQFAEATANLFGADPLHPWTAAAVLDLDEQGRYTLIAIEGDGTVVLYLVEGGQYHRKQTGITLPPEFAAARCVVGDFHNVVPAGETYDAAKHARNDVLIIGAKSMALFRQEQGRILKDVTESAGLADVTATAAAWGDYDHDGDLDLLLATGDGLALRQNNGDRTLTDVTKDVGIDPATPAVDVAFGEFDGNNALDFIAAGGQEPSHIYLNQRAGRFAKRPQPPGPLPAGMHVAADDVSGDGLTDVVLSMADAAGIAIAPGLTVHQSVGTDVKLNGSTLLDFDNNGAVELLAFGRKAGGDAQGALLLMRNEGDAGWRDVTAATGLEALNLPVVQDVIAADLDADGDADLLLIANGAAPVYLRNYGGNAHGQLKLRLVSVKTNPSGYGSQVQVRAGQYTPTRFVGSPVVEIGLASHNKAEALRTVWTNGVIDNLIEPDFAQSPLTVKEKVVATGSCPFLFVWDGTRFRFVTDILGNAPVGLSLTRDRLLPADPSEFVYAGSAADVQPRDGMYEFAVTEEFREVLYLDEVRLFAVDHPAGTEIHTTDKLMPEPFPASELWRLAPAAPLRRATNDRGEDVTLALTQADRYHAPPGKRLPPPYRGMCEPHALTFDFGPLATEEPLVLALTGWLQYGDASTNIALSQNPAIRVIPPQLEVAGEENDWQPVDVVVGMPAGKTKTILVDLNGKLPDGARRLRLTTTFEVRWDRAALMRKESVEAQGSANVRELTPAEATLSYRGFSHIEADGTDQPTIPDYAEVYASPRWYTTPQGWCTRFGDVGELVAERDGRMVIANAGDLVTLRFPADSLPPVARGHTRSFFFYSYGWEKDGDYNVVDGDMVGPLPCESNDAAIDLDATALPPNDWRVRYNTRFVPADRFAPGNRTEGDTCQADD